MFYPNVGHIFLCETGAIVFFALCEDGREKTDKQDDWGEIIELSKITASKRWCPLTYRKLFVALRQTGIPAT